MKKQKFLIFGMAFFVTLFVLCGAVLVHQCADGQKSAKAFADVAKLVQEVQETPENDAAETVPREVTAYEKYVPVLAENSDFVGWLSIDGTQINYPVVQTPDATNYYLKRNFQKQHSNYGTPYVQENCDIDLSDNIVIYGHNMRDGSMFADLCKYEDEDFYKTHKVIRFDTLSDYGEYEIVAAFKTVAYSDDGFKYYHFVNAESRAEFDAFVKKCKALADYDTGVGAKYGDKLLTLSTCEYSRENGRMVVVAKLVKPAEKGANANA